MCEGKKPNNLLHVIKFPAHTKSVKIYYTLANTVAQK